MTEQLHFSTDTAAHRDWALLIPTTPGASEQHSMHYINTNTSFLCWAIAASSSYRCFCLRATPAFRTFQGILMCTEPAVIPPPSATLWQGEGDMSLPWLISFIKVLAGFQLHPDLSDFDCSFKDVTEQLWEFAFLGGSSVDPPGAGR